MKLHSSRGMDLATTSRSVTSLAHDARRVLTGPVNESETEELILRIERLQEEWREIPSAPIHAWLENLRRQVERD
ncbi:MAG: hypothetical protein JWN86_3409 [Planctomycetota bacterium]|nr:hypothetical protein [Planctomycetota bacterium]